MKFDALSLQKFLMGECEPLETLVWLSDIFFARDSFSFKY